MVSQEPQTTRSTRAIIYNLSGVQESSERLDKWFTNQSRATSFDDTFTSDVAVLRHVTDFETGKRSTVCFGKDTLQKQTSDSFGQRNKHNLAEVVIPQQYMTFVQSYEVTKDAEGRQWRQSSLRIRVLDPNQNYKLRLGLIFYSERDSLPQQRMLKQSGQLHSSMCPAPRPAAETTQQPATHTAVAAAVNGKARPAPRAPSEALQSPAPSKKIKRMTSGEAVTTT